MYLDPLKNYIELRHLGDGFYGSVDLYKDMDTDKLFAIKTMSKKSLIKNLGPSGEDRVRSEVSEMTKISGANHCHPTLLCYYGLIETNKDMHVAMEYFEGKEIRELVSNYQSTNTHIKEKDIRKFIRHITDALYYIHSNGIVHRDIKDDNIMYNSNRIVLIDFNLMCETIEKDCLKVPAGSIMFMAPEVYETIKDRSKTMSFDDWTSADVFSMGGVLWELVYGKEPVDDFKDLKVTKKPSYISDEVYNIIVKMLEKNPKKRITTLELKNYVDFFLS